MGIQRFAAADIGRIFGGHTVAGLSEWQLLERYLERQDEVAFEALVARHGPMVLGVCRRMLTSQTDVEDAFQATFLVLVRRARQLGPRDAIGPWLHGVAARVALRAHCEAARRRRFESTHIDAAAAVTGPSRSPGDFDLAETLDQELSRLPPRYRSPIVLCYLEGQTHEEAARLLKWPVGTVKGRLARARDLLRCRLARRGLAPTALGVIGLLGSELSASIPRALLETTVRSSLKYAIGRTTAQVASTSIASLVEGALTAMFFSKIQWAGAVFSISALALFGAGVMAQQHGRPLEVKFARALEPVADEAGPKAAAAGTGGAAKTPADTIAGSKISSADASPSVPMPGEMSTSLSERENQLLQAAKQAWNKVYAEYATGNGTVDRLHDASVLLLDAQKETAESPTDAAAAVADHLDRIRSIARLRQTIPHGSATKEGDNAKLLALAAKAELELAQGGIGGGGGQGGGGFGGDAGPKSKKGSSALAGQGHGKDPRSRLIVKKLDDLIALHFPDETPLDEFLKHIKETTKSAEMPRGIPIYIDPSGLQDAEKSLTSTITIDLEGVPLKRTLQLVLKQLGLAYFVEDGMIFITSEESFDNMSHLGPAIPEESPILDEGERALRGELSVNEMQDWLAKYKAYCRVKKALEEEKVGELSEFNAPALDAEVTKLTSINEELRKKLDKVEAQMTEIRQLLSQLGKQEKPEKAAKKARELQ